MKPIIAITVGDFNGIGPEVALKAALHPSVKKICTPLIIGPLNVIDHVRAELKLKVKLVKASFPVLKNSVLNIADVGDGIFADVQYGMVTKGAGKSAGVAIERAVELCVQGKIRAMVTAPVSKEALNLAGFHFPGQTEMVTLLSRSPRVAMMLVSDTMRIGLVTIHSELRSVAEQLSQDKVFEKISIVHESLLSDFSVKNPRIAVLALNPHGGEHGLLGKEEDEIIRPALERSRTSNVAVDGPFSADAFFGNHRYKQYDAVVAMYHDQGLIPLKMSSFGKAVNFSAGLTIVRTSPDHGTAFDIAGKNKANISSMVEAVKLAVRISSNRIRND